MSEVKTSLKMTAYTVYDSVLQEYSSPICISPENMKQDFNVLVNSPNSKYYEHESDYILFAIGEFDSSTGLINYYNPIKIATLDTFIDKNQRNIQIMLRNLNYLPQGYFKMPDEMKKDIQEKIDDSIKFYTETFIKPSLDNITPQLNGDKSSS